MAPSYRLKGEYLPSTLPPFMCSHIQKVNTRGCPQKCHKPETASHARGAKCQRPEPLASGVSPATSFPSWGSAQLGLWEGGCPACRPGGHRDPPAHLGSGFVWWFEKRWVGRTSNADNHVKARRSPHHDGPAYETETVAVHERGMHSDLWKVWLNCAVYFGFQK